MANSRTIEFKGHFDGKQVLDELKKIRQNMADAGADDNLFKGIDKDIAATEKLVTEMMAQIQKGFSNTKEVNAFEKQIDKLQTNFLKISSGMQNINIAENFGLNSPEINKLTKEIEQLTAAQDHLKEVSKNALDQAQKSIGLRNDEVAEIKKAIDANEDLEEALKKVGKAKEKATLANVGSNAAKTDAGKEYLSKASIGLSLDDLGAKASSGNTAKAKNDARKRYDNGELYGSAGNRELDETKANAAINEVYQKTLEKMVTTGGNAAEAIEEMKKALADYGIEIENVDKLQENFYSDIEGFYKSPAVSGGAKSAVTKARKIGQTDAQGNYQLSENSMTNLVNNEEITASTRAEQELTQKIRERGEAEKKAQEEGAQAANKHSESLQDVNKNIEDSSQALKKGAEDTNDFAEAQQKLNSGFDNIKGAIKTFLSLGSAVNALRSVFNETFESVKTLDKSFAQIAMVTDYSVQEMWSSYGQYAEMANELGQSTQSVIQASGLFYQQGLETNEALELTQDTMKLATLAGLDFSEATSQMTAALRGFHMEMDEGSRVTDVYSELAAKAAADVEGIAYAMSKTASIASSAGMEFETTSAFLTQMIETTQEAPENIGTAMKTIIARFTELKENVAGTADSEFEDLDYNKVDTALKSVGISLKDASGQFRNLDDVFLELSEKWNTLDRNSQRYIATIAAGSRQQSRFIAMMENYDRTIELVNTAYNSSGKSAEQFAKYQDTLEYKINKLQNSWEQLRVSLMNSDFFKGVVDTVGSLVKYLSKLNLGQIVIHIIAIASALKMVSAVINGIQTGEKLKSLGEMLSNVKGLSGKIDEKMQSKKKKTTEEKIKESGEVAGEKISEKIKESGEHVSNNLSENITSSGENAANKMEEAIKEGGKQAAEEISNAIQSSNEDTQENNESKEEKTDQDNDNKENTDAIDNEEDKTKIYQQEEEKRTEIAKIEELQRTRDAALAEQEEAHQAALREAEESKMAAMAEIEEGNVAKAAEIDEAYAAKIAEIEEANAAKRAEIEEAHAAQLAEIREGSSGGVGRTGGAGGTGGAGKLAKAGKVLSAGMAVAEIAAIAGSIGSYIGSKMDEKTEELAKQQEEAYNNAIGYTTATFTTGGTQTAKSNTQSLVDATKAIEELQNKPFLSDEQQNTLNESIAFMNENYSNLVDSYDENTGKMTLLTDALDEEIKAQQEHTQALLREETGAIATQATKGYGRLANDWGNDIAGEDRADKWYSNSSKTMAYAGVGGAAAGALVGAALGSAVPVLGTAIGAALGLAVGGIAALFNENYERTTTNTTEAISKFRELDAETQNKVYQELGEGIDNLSELETWIGNNTERLQEVINVTGKILEEVAHENNLKQGELAVEEYTKNYEFKNAKGEDVKIADGIIEDFYNRYNTKDVGDMSERIGKYQEELYNEDTSKDRRQEIMKLFSFEKDTFDEEGNKIGTENVSLFDEYYGANGVWGKYASLLDKNGKTKDFEALTESQQKTAIELFGSEDKYVSGQELSKEWLNSKAIDNYMGKFVEQTSQFGIQAFENLTENINFDDWDEKYQKAISGEQSAEEMKNNIAQIQEEMRKQGIDEQVINSYWSEEAQKIVEEAEKASNYLIEQGWDEGVVKNMSTQTVTSFNQQLTNLADQGDETTARAITNLYKNAISKAWDSPELTDDQKQKISAFLTSLTPETFDTTKTQEYEETLVKFGLSSEEAADAVIYLDKEIRGLDYSKSITEIKGLEEGFKALAEQAQNAQSKMKDFISLATDFAKEGMTSDILFKLSENGYGDSINLQTGQIDFGNALSAFTDEQYNNAQEIWEEMKKNPAEAEKEMTNLYATQLSIVEAYDSIGETTKELAKEEEKASKDLSKALKDEEKAWEAVADAEKEYNEAKTGSEFYLPNIDAAYNYTNQLDRNNKQLERMNELLSEAETIQDKITYLSEKNGLEHEASVLRQAQIKNYEESIADNQKWLNDNAGEYLTMLEDGTYILNASFYDAKMPDAWSDEIIRRMQETSDWISTKEDLADQEIEAEKRRTEELKKYREDYLSFLEKGADILKQQAEEEVKTLEDKYNALEEADNNYLDALEEAIEKQRKLREQENAYEDLATKQKKLSLMQRDTSGANQKDIQSLEKEVQDDQQNLLDQEIDNMIDGLRDLYESQQELRNEEVELKNAIMEETNYTKQFAEIASTWTSAEDAKDFFMENTDTSNMLVEEIESQMTAFADAYTQGSIYMANNHDEVVKFTEATSDEVQNKINELGNYLTLTTQTTTDSVEQDIRDMVADAKEKWEDAKESANEASDAVADYQTALSEAETARKTWELNAKQGQADMLKTMTDNFTQESVELQKITIQALQTIFSDDQIMKQLGLSKDQFDSILNGDLLKSLQEQNTKGELSKEQENFFSNYINTKDDKGLEALKQQYIDKYFANSEDVRRYGVDANTLFQDDYEKYMNSKYSFNTNNKLTSNNDYNPYAAPDKDPMSIWGLKAAMDPYYVRSSGYTTEEGTADSYTKKLMTPDGERTYIFVNKQKYEDFIQYLLDRFHDDGLTEAALTQFATGGLVNYTGPAWVDGTPAKPEAFLNAQDTQRIGEAAKILAQIPALNGASENVSTNIGDTTIEIHINVESIESDYDVDQMIERVKNDILDVSKPTGTSVILKK